MSAARPPALLCDASFYGTLAAVRSLGRAGITVRVADSGRMGPALWSRYTAGRLHCPSVTTVPRFLDWLLALARRDGRHVLYPTSDELAYLLSAHRADLADGFALYQPDLETTMRVLDKRLLLEAAREAGIDAPATWFVDTAKDLERAAREADGPLMLKPRTQLFLRHHRKGALVHKDPARLVREYDAWRKGNVFGEPIASQMPELMAPMVQLYYPDATRWIYSLSGFRNRAGRVPALRGAVKVLQRPRTLGVGLCFESAPVEPDLAARVGRLLDRLGYHGVFEMEFVRSKDRLLLIDMNPRFYNQVAFDVARGLDLPRLAYDAALGNDDDGAALVTEESPGVSADAFCNTVGLKLQVGAQQLFGTMSTAEAATWRRWTRDRVVVDSTASQGDPGPLVADVMNQVYGVLRHPRAFLRMIALDR